MPSSRKPNSPNLKPDDRISEYRAFSRRMLNCANQGLLRVDFLQKVATILLEFARCDTVEMWIKQDGEHHRCVLSRSGTDSFRYKRVSRSLNATGRDLPSGKGAVGLEELGYLVIQGAVAPEPPYFTKSGSFWIGDTGRTFDVRPADGAGKCRVDVSTGERCRSLALIPIVIETQCLGLLQLKDLRGDYFTGEDISFYEDTSQILGMALAHQRAQIELRERVKELTCLYGIAQVVAQMDASSGKILQEIVELLPPAWLYPEIAVARIFLEGRSYSTTHFHEAASSLKEDILIKGTRVGFVEVAYVKARHTLDEGPFLSEERSLIKIVAREVAHFYEQRKSEDERVLLHDQLRHADRLATIGQLAAGVAHELNEPLGNILGFAQLAQKGPDLPDDASRDMDKIIAASLYAREIIKKLMVFARQMPARKFSVNLNSVVEDGLYFFEARCAKAGIDLVRRLARDLPDIKADSGQLNQVLVNLVVNSIQAMPKGGTLTVETRADGDHLFLVVADTGKGMSDAVKDQIFIPFFTTKDVDEGTGLGLAVVHGIVTSHRGSIEVESKVRSGTRFEIRLPVKEPIDF